MPGPDRPPLLPALESTDGKIPENLAQTIEFQRVSWAKKDPDVAGRALEVLGEDA